MSKAGKSRLLFLSVGVAVTMFAVAPVSRAQDMAAAQQNYATYCVKCHGEKGKGDGASAATLQTKPRDFTECARMQKIPDDEMFKVIKEGGKANGMSGDMQAWSQAFEDGEIHALVAYVRTFCKK